MIKYIGIFYIVFPIAIFMFLMIKYPLKQVLGDNYKSHVALSVYGVYDKTRFIFNSLLFVTGVLGMIMYRYYIIRYEVNIYLTILFIISCIAMCIISLVPTILEDIWNFQRIVHAVWALIIMFGLSISSIWFSFYVLKYTQLSLIMIFFSLTSLLAGFVSYFLTKHNKLISEICFLLPYGFWILTLNLIDLLVL